MANTKSSKKDMKRSAKKRLINTSVKSALKTHIKKVKTAAHGDDAAVTQQNLVQAISALDKAVQRGIIHKNSAARRKSRIAKLAASSASGELTPAAPAKAKVGGTAGKAKAKAKPKAKAK